MKHLAAACLLLASLSVARATTIGFSSTSLGNSFYDSGGALLANGDLIRVGTFSNPGALSLGMTVAEMETIGGWSDFGSLYTQSIFGHAGKVTGSLVDNSAAANAFNNDNTYVWVFDSATAANATATGIFRASAGAPAWSFPVNGGGINDAVSLHLDEATMQAISGVGSVDLGQNKLQLSGLVPVPEASATALLYVVGGLLFFGTQRFRLIA